MEALSGFLSTISPWAGLFVQAVQMAEALAPQSATPVTGAQKKSAAVAAVTSAINAAPAVTADVVQLQAAVKSNDPATVAAGIGHGVEMALSFCKSFGLFSKAQVVQNAAPLASEVPAIAPNS